MKKILLVATLLIGSVASAFAQFVPFGEEEKMAHFGLTVDMNSSTLSKGEGVKSKIGAAVGFKGDFLINQYVFFDYGLKWSMKGYKIKDYDDFSATAHYFDIPVHVGARYAFGYDRKMSVFAEFGPYFGIGLAGTMGTGDKNDVDYFGDKGANSFDFGLGFAVGFRYNIIELHLGYDFGLINLNDSSNAPQNRNFYVGLGFMF